MNKRIPILLGFLCLAFGIWLEFTTVPIIESIITRLENLTYDMELRTKVYTHPETFQTPVVIVDIDDKTLDKEGRWPWPRAKLGQLITRLQEEGAAVIALDMFFPVKEENVTDELAHVLTQGKMLTPQIAPVLKKVAPLFDNDAHFAASLRKSDTVLGMSFLPRPQTTGVLPPPLLTLKTFEEKKLAIQTELGFLGNIPVIQEATKFAGFINITADDDGIIRRAPLLLRYHDDVYPSLALEAVRVYLLANVKLTTAKYGKIQRLEGIEVGKHFIPTDEKGNMIISFRGRSFTFPYFSATDVLNKKIPADELQGKIVFVGTSATGLGDLKATAIQSIFPGVEIQATIADEILTDNYTYRPAWVSGLELLLIIFLGASCAISFPYLGPRLIAAVVVLIPTFLVLINNWLWEEWGLVVSIFIPCAMILLQASINMSYGYLFETRRREHLKGMFGQYVPEKHIDEMLKTSGSNYGLYGEDRNMTVLFADIRDFTTISERMSATQLKELLNDFFTPMTEIIFKHRGTIDKYVGDMIMAFWGAPLKDRRHAEHAISAALDMSQALDGICAKLIAQGEPAIEVGIGLNTGNMSVGDMGSKFRRNYTVLGDAVNLASRIEGLTRYYGTRILVSEFTIENQKNFIFRQVDRVRVKGKDVSVGIYEVLCRQSEATHEILRETESSALALKYYFNREWVGAWEVFTELHAMYPSVKLYSLYLERINEYEKNPPPDDWDGIYTHVVK